MFLYKKCTNFFVNDSNISPAKSELYDAASRVLNSKTKNQNAINLEIGNMIVAAQKVTKAVSEKIYTKIGQDAKAAEGGVEKVFDSYKTVRENGVIFPDFIENDFNNLQNKIENGEAIPDTALGSFIYNAQIYTPRALILSETYNRISQENAKAGGVLLDGEYSDLEDGSGLGVDRESAGYMTGTANPQLQSVRNSDIINNNNSTGDGVNDVSGRNVQGLEGSTGKSGTANTEAENNSRGNYEETSKSFVGRIAQVNERSNRGRRLHRIKSKSGKETLIAYTPKDFDNTEGYRAVELLRKKGYDVDYSDGAIETNSGGITRLSNNAITTKDGKIIVSSNNQGTAEQTADHEEVHLLQNLDDQAFIEYESVFCGNLIVNDGAYLKVAQQINKEHFCVEERINEETGEIERIGKFSDEELLSTQAAPKIFKELIAYLRQAYNFDADLAKREYGDLFRDWGEVAEAIVKFNEAVSSNTKADFSGSSSFSNKSDVQANKNEGDNPSTEYQIPTNTDVEKAAVDYYENNVDEIKEDLARGDDFKIKNIFAGHKKGFVRILSNGEYESGTYGEGTGIALNENLIRTSSLEEAIISQYKYMLENGGDEGRRMIQKHSESYKKNHHINNTKSGDNTKPDNEIYKLSKNILPSTENKKERRKVTLAEQQTVKKFAEGLRGKKVEFFDAEKVRIENELEEMPDGYTDGDTLYISDRAENPLAFVFAHEFTDSVAMDYITTDENGNTVFTKEYEELINYTLKSEVFLNYAKSNGYDTAIRFIWATVKKRQNAGDSNFVGKNTNEVRKQACIELFSDFIGSTVTGDINSIEKFANKMNNSQKNTFFTMLKNFIAKIKANIASFMTGDRRHIFRYEIGIIENKLAKLYQNAPATTEEQNNNTVDNSGVRYNLSKDVVRSWNIAWDSNNHSSLKEQLREHIDEVNKMQPVATVIYNKQSKKPYYQILNELLKEKFGYKIQRKEYGTIIFDSSTIDQVRNYINNDAEAAAMIATPYVLKRGKAITGHKNHKDKGNVSVTFAAPVVLNGKIGNVAVCVIYGKGQVHSLRVLTPEGKTFELLKIKDTESTITGHSTKTMAEPYIDSASNDIILSQEDTISQDYSMQKSKKNSDFRYSIPTAQASLLDKYDRGEISREEFLNQSNENWKEAVNTYGAIETGENPVNDIPVPKSVDGRQKTQRFARTVIESGKLTDGMVEDMGADILLGKFAYTPVSDESAQAAADKAVKGGFAESSWQEAVNASKLITKDKIAIGEKLLMQAIANKDTKRALELSSELADVLTRNGQNIQAARMFKKMTGAGKLLTVQQYVNTLNKDLGEKYGGKAPTVKIDELIAQQIAESKPGEDIESLYQDALQDVAAQVPATFLDKWNAWRYMSMLVNPTTHIRNIAGNGLFIPSVRMKDFISASLETAFIKDKDKRTKSVVIKADSSVNTNKNGRRVTL